MRKLIYKKGLLLKVVSWENDADLYETTETYIDDLEKAKAYTYMFKTLFKSESNGENGIGNASEGDYKKKRIEEFRQETDYFRDNFTEDEFFQFIHDRSGEFVGYSEWYAYRVCESAELFEVKEDVYLDIVKVE